MTEHTYGYWEAALRGEHPPIHDGLPQLGFYRTKPNRRQNGASDPVAIYVHEGEVVALRGRTPVDAAEIWTWVAQHPITEEVWRAVAERGEPWPGTDPIVVEAVAQAGHNSGAVDDAEALRDQIAAAAAGVGKYREITDDETAAAAQSLRSRLLELKGTAEQAHKAEKAPHLEAGRLVDDKWNPIARDAKAAADTIRAALDHYQNAKAKAEREARQRAEAEARAAAAAGQPAPEPVEPEPARPAAIRGGYGRAAGVRTVRVAIVEDQDAVYAALRDNPEIKTLIAKLAQKVVAAGGTLAGVRIEDQRKVA